MSNLEKAEVVSIDSRRRGLLKNAAVGLYWILFFKIMLTVLLGVFWMGSLMSGLFMIVWPHSVIMIFVLFELARRVRKGDFITAGLWVMSYLFVQIAGVIVLTILNFDAIFLIVFLSVLQIMIVWEIVLLWECRRLLNG